MDNQNIPPEFIRRLSESISISPEGEWTIATKSVETDEEEAISTLKAKLVSYQLSAFDHIRWLFYGGRATGRTFLMAVISVCEALHQPTKKITVTDHHHHLYGEIRTQDERIYLFGAINDALSLLPDEMRKNFTMNVSERWIRYM